jgi:hypothetical protein
VLALNDDGLGRHGSTPGAQSQTATVAEQPVDQP